MIFCLQDSIGHHMRADKAVQTCPPFVQNWLSSGPPRKAVSHATGVQGLREVLFSESADKETG